MNSFRTNDGSGDRGQPFEYGFEGDASVSVAIVEAIAAFERVAPTRSSTELGFTLYDYVDTDAVDALFDGYRSERLELEFTVDRYEVRIEGGGRILVSVAEH